MSDDREPSQSEIERAHALAEALSGEKEPASAEDAELVDLARSLRAANTPADLDAKDNEEILSRALSKKDGAKKSGDGGGRVIRVTFGAVAALALAAAIFLLVTRPKPQDETGEVATFMRSRSTQPLFQQPFKPGDAAARIDRIAMARERDYRENRFTARRTR
jgi:hypothetical protein